MNISNKGFRICVFKCYVRLFFFLIYSMVEVVSNRVCLVLDVLLVYNLLIVRINRVILLVWCLDFFKMDCFFGSLKVVVLIF